MEPQKPGNFLGSGPEVVERRRVAKERAAQTVRSWTVQNEMRGILCRVTAGAAGRILDSANPRKIGAQQKTVSCNEGERGQSKRDEKAGYPCSSGVPQ